MSGKLEGDLSVAYLKEQVPLIGPAHQALQERGKSSLLRVQDPEEHQRFKNFSPAVENDLLLLGLPIGSGMGYAENK